MEPLTAVAAGVTVLAKVITPILVNMFTTKTSRAYYHSGCKYLGEALELVKTADEENLLTRQEIIDAHGECKASLLATRVRVNNTTSEKWFTTWAERSEAKGFKKQSKLFVQRLKTVTQLTSTTREMGKHITSLVNDIKAQCNETTGGDGVIGSVSAHAVDENQPLTLPLQSHTLSPTEKPLPSLPQHHATGQSRILDSPHEYSRAGQQRPLASGAHDLNPNSLVLRAPSEHRPPKISRSLSRTQESQSVPARGDRRTRQGPEPSIPILPPSSTRATIRGSQLPGLATDQRSALHDGSGSGRLQPHGGESRTSRSRSHQRQSALPSARQPIAQNQVVEHLPRATSAERVPHRSQSHSRGPSHPRAHSEHRHTHRQPNATDPLSIPVSPNPVLAHSQRRVSRSSNAVPPPNSSRTTRDETRTERRSHSRGNDDGRGRRRERQQSFTHAA
ncbi:hypothetical protein CVT24_001924 [Panaeolus cyanescens]|uniref:Uncharacterized protein n=1 Tax=Panaeolus cyanescens TaxID=181874 RepID=A0A409WXX5_9AGAR|nr:hypothetical protein CVT24_001924 [Panaeolus cyanescens]